MEEKVMKEMKTSEEAQKQEHVAVNEGKKNHFRYDAFISYRHSELDKFVAENLHKQLEAFRMPKSVAKKREGQKNRIERVFRDKEELPLTSDLNDPIMTALHNSEWLIVICSPRLRESLWCKKEIETFVNLRGRERVLAVLIEGEPAESFPDELLYRIEKKTNPDGTVEEIKIPVEPLAADVRGKTKKEVLKAMKTEVLRLCAGMFRLNYDDLRQRHKEQRNKRIMTMVSLGAVACLLFAIFCGVIALNLHDKNQKIQALADTVLEQHEELKYNQALSMSELSLRYLEEGNRGEAIRTATQALTEVDYLSMPYTPEAHFALAESLGVYDTGDKYVADYQIETDGMIWSMAISPDMDTVAIHDSTYSVLLYDLQNEEVIDVLQSNIFLEDYYAFLGDNRFIYIEEVTNTISVYDISSREVVEQFDFEGASSITVSTHGNYFAIRKLDTYYIYDGNTLELIGQNESIEANAGKCYISDDGILACEYSRQEDQSSMVQLTDISTMQVCANYDLEGKELVDIVAWDNKAYIISNQMNDTHTMINGYVTAVDTQSGSLLWENVYENNWINQIKLSVGESAKDLIITTETTAVLMDMETGNIDMFLSLPSAVVRIQTYEDQNAFLLLCKDGEVISAFGDSKETYDLSEQLECKTQNIEQFLLTSCGFFVVGKNEDVLTVYTAKPGPEVTVSEKEYTYWEPETIENVEAYDKAVEIGMKEPDYVRSILYSDDERYIFVQYYDYTMVIYDTEYEMVVNTIEDVETISYYLGCDEEGYTYLCGYTGGYILDSDMKPVMWIENMMDVDLEAGVVYLSSGNGTVMEAPIYTVEELIEMAQPYMPQEEETDS